MAKGDAKSAPALGFLTVVEHSQHGLMGGYLLLNLGGRPLEFHCTAPIKPNRAQQILYGPTLEPFLYGEQIGHALVAKSSQEPLLVCTDLPPVLALRSLISAPVALVGSGEPSPPAEASSGAVLRIDGAHAGLPRLHHFQAGRNQLALAPDREADRGLILERLGAIDDLFDLSEPFGRIRSAIEEAQRGNR